MENFKTSFQAFASALYSTFNLDPHTSLNYNRNRLVDLSNEAGKEYVNVLANDPSRFNEMFDLARNELPHELLMLSPWMNRSFSKPLGYPGDYLTMVGLYNENRLNAYLYENEDNQRIGKIANDVFTSTAAAQAVRNRKDHLVNVLRNRLNGDYVRILSVASGPAQELQEVLSTIDSRNLVCDIVLLDQDPFALAYGHNRAQTALAGVDHEVTIQAVNQNVVDVIEGKDSFQPLGKFDVILAAGIFDYFGDKKWVTLANLLSAQLSTAGELYLGNMVPTSPSRWFMEIYLDWNLKYRTTQKMLELANYSVESQGRDVRLVEEATGVNPFVVISA